LLAFALAAAMRHSYMLLVTRIVMFAITEFRRQHDISEEGGNIRVRFCCGAGFGGVFVPAIFALPD
jgi:hypothetical protein